MKRLTAILLGICLLSGCAGAALPQSASSGSEATSSSVATSSSLVESSSGSGSGGDESSVSDVGSSSSAPAVQKLVIPEGFTLARIGITLENMGVCTTAEFIEAAQTGDFSDFSLVADRANNPNKCFLLEGYLFPDTYEINVSATPDAIIRMMLRNLEKRMDSTIRSDIAASGFTTDEVLALASIIEKESPGVAEMNNISSVLHNRLEIGMKLQCDVSITYVEGAIKPFIDGDIDRYNEYYNTYKCPALPAGAICNPGIAAIRAALAPTQTDYLYFFTDKENNVHYNAVYETHQSEYDKMKAEGKA